MSKQPSRRPITIVGADDAGAFAALVERIGVIADYWFDIVELPPGHAA